MSDNRRRAMFYRLSREPFRGNSLRAQRNRGIAYGSGIAAGVLGLAALRGTRGAGALFMRTGWQPIRAGTRIIRKRGTKILGRSRVLTPATGMKNMPFLGIRPILDYEAAAIEKPFVGRFVRGILAKDSAGKAIRVPAGGTPVRARGGEVIGSEYAGIFRGEPQWKPIRARTGEIIGMKNLRGTTTKMVESVPWETRKIWAPAKRAVQKGIGSAVMKASLWRIPGFRKGVEAGVDVGEKKLRKVSRQLADALAAPKLPAGAYAPGGLVSQTMRKTYRGDAGAKVRLKLFHQGIVRALQRHRGAAAFTDVGRRRVHEDAKKIVQRHIRERAIDQLRDQYPSRAAEALAKVFSPAYRGVTKAENFLEKTIVKTARKAGLNVPVEVYVKAPKKVKNVVGTEATFDVDVPVRVATPETNFGAKTAMRIKKKVRAKVTRYHGRRKVTPRSERPEIQL